MATIRITNLKLKAVIGTNDWERKIKQQVIINATLRYNALKASQSDKLKDTLDYKALTKKIIEAVEASKFFLLEKLTHSILTLILKDKKVKEAWVRVDKPRALRFADSVSVELHKKR